MSHYDRTQSSPAVAPCPSVRCIGWMMERMETRGADLCMHTTVRSRRTHDSSGWLAACLPRDSTTLATLTLIGSNRRSDRSHLSRFFRSSGLSDSRCSSCQESREGAWANVGESTARDGGRSRSWQNDSSLITSRGVQKRHICM